MKTSAHRVHNLLLAVAMAVPLWAATGTAGASASVIYRGNDSVNDKGSVNDNDSAGGSAHDEGNQHPPMMRGGGDQDGPEHGHGIRGGMPPFGAPGSGFGPGQGPGPGRGFGGMGGAHAPFLRGVELTEAQEDKVFAILHAEKPYLRDQAKAAAKAHEALRDLAGADKYDDAKAASLAHAAGTAMANIALQHVRTQQKLMAVLTPEQRKRQAEKGDERRAEKPADDKDGNGKDGNDKDGKDVPHRPR